MDKSEHILITGVAGFIGSALAKKLLVNGQRVIGIDNINNYYDINLKKDRIKYLIEETTVSNWTFELCDLCDEQKLDQIFSQNKIKMVINLAAQAGVRYSISNPKECIRNNIDGFVNILEFCKKYQVKDFIYASSSSVYGGNKNYPYNENLNVDHPISLYAATKKSNELIAHVYSHLFGIRVTGLRLFTVYGPWGRPDMAPMIFTKSILKKEPINVYNYGEMQRDFTYIDDIVEAIFRCCFKKTIRNKNFDYLKPDSSSSFAPYQVFNIGNSSPIGLLKFIDILEDAIGIKAVKNFMPIQPGDVSATFSDNSKLKNWVNFEPLVDVKKGVEIFVRWYKKYYGF